VEANTASDRSYSAGYRELRGPSRSNTSARASALPLIREAPLIVLSLLSLGFWGAVVVAVASLALARVW
jgi:hypothetical protein